MSKYYALLHQATVWQAIYLADYPKNVAQLASLALANQQKSNKNVPPMSKKAALRAIEISFRDSAYTA